MLRCALIGLGWWGGEHAAATQGKSNLLRIEACHTDSGDNAADVFAMRDFADRFGARPFERLDALLADQAIDAVIITTPHSRHVPQIIAAAEAGIDEEQVTLHTALGSREELEIDPVEPAETLRLELEEFARACAGDGSFRIDPENALRNIAVMEAAITATCNGSATKVETF